MTPHQEETLWASIEHWLENWQDPDTANPMGEDCPCCQEYYDDSYDEDEHGCKKCPISQYTGEGDCVGTPWAMANITWRRRYLMKHNQENRPTKEEVKDTFEREYRFLVKLALGELK